MSLLLRGPLRRRPGRGAAPAPRATSRAGRRRGPTPSTRTPSTTCSSRTAPRRSCARQRRILAGPRRRSPAPRPRPAVLRIFATARRLRGAWQRARRRRRAPRPRRRASTTGRSRAARARGSCACSSAPTSTSTYGDPALGPESIAAAHFISRRHLDRALRGRRRERGRDDPRAPPRALPARSRGPARAGESILEIATRWGVREPGALQPRVPRGLRHVTEGAG